MITSRPSASTKSSVDARLSPRVEQLPIELLRSNPRNSRTHSRKQIKQIAASIKAFGFLNAILADDTNMVLAGHGRLEAARSIGLDQVPVVRFGHLSEAQKRAYLIADNKIAEQSGLDREILAIELGELLQLLPSQGFDISLTGFETPEIDQLLADMTPSRSAPEDALPDLPNTPTTGPGDVWVLGDHRLMCGDSRDFASIGRLMDGACASAVCCDPPYNRPVKEIGGRGRTQHPEFAFASGEMPRPRFREFLKQTLSNGIRVSAEGTVHFVFMDWRHISDLIDVGNELYGAMLNLVVWNKTNAGQGSYYRSQHELIGVFRVGDQPHRNNIQLGSFGRNRSNVWTYAGVNTFGRGRDEALASHPTVKPVALVADALLDCTARGDIVLDQFVGSGTTIMAAEKVGRIGFGIEYEPAYVDVAIKRWQSATKLEAVLAGDGRTFDEIGAARIRLTETAPPQRNNSAAKSSTIVRNQSRNASAKRSSSPSKGPRASVRSRGRNG